jgi:GDP-4-dehydro-6-deoxy-D-mannose reductase
MAAIEFEVQADHSLVRESDLPVACGDASRARQMLGWTPTTPWTTTLRDVLEDWRGRVVSEAVEG